MRIAYVIEASSGGAGKHVVDAVSALVARGHQVDLYYSPLRSDAAFLAGIERAGVRAFTIPMRRAPHPLDIVALWQLQRLLAKNGPYDIIHAHSAKAGMLCVLLSWWVRVPLVFTPHLLPSMNPTFGKWKQRIYQMGERWMAKRLYRLVCVANTEYHYAQTILGIPSSQLASIPNGIPPLVMVPRAQARKQLGIPDDRLVIGCVGRLMPEKGIDLLLEAAARVREGAGKLAYEVAIVGDGPDYPALQSLHQQLQLDGAVRFLGYQKAEEVLLGFDLLVMPSRIEAFPYILLEAMQAGLPMVVTDVGSVKEMVKDAAVVISPSAEALAKGMLQLLFHPEQRAQLAEKARARAEYFTLDHMVDALEGVYGLFS